MRTEQNNDTLRPIDLTVLLGDLLSNARRFWWLALAMILVLSGLFSVQARRSYSPRYEANTTFTVHVADPLQDKVRGYNTATADQMAKTFPYILTSSALKDVVMRDLGLEWLPPIEASVTPSTNIFTLKVTANTPELAYNVLNSVIEHYPDVAEFVVGPTFLDLLDESGMPEAPLNEMSYRGAVKKGILAGGVLWLALLLLMVMSRSTVHNEDELRQLINVRCMGALPRVRQRSKQGICPMVTDPQTSLSFTESVRLMRVRVEKELEEGGRKVLLVSSAIPGEGKTTVAVNLAQTLAVKGKRVLLVDCDLRNPSVARNLGIENKNGLVDLVQGTASAKKIRQQTGLENFTVVAAGGPAENAAELLARKECRSFIESCRKEYDYVILDTPPISLLADAAEIADSADAALLVIRQNFASRTQILEGTQLLADSGLPLVGCALNCTANNVLTGRDSYYGYGYGYGSYGRYGHYGYEQTAPENGEE